MHSHVLWLHHVMKKVLVDMLYDFLPIMLDSADSCQNMAIYSWWWLMLMDFGYFCYVSFSTAMLALEHLNQKKDHMIFLTFCQNKVLSWPSWIIGVMDKRSNAHPELPLAPLPPSYSFRPAAMLLGPCFFFFFASATLTNCLPQLHTPFTSSCILHLVGCTASTDFFYPANFLSVMLLKDI